MDPLSDVLSLLKPRNYMSAGFDAGDDWSIQFPDQQKSIKTGAVVSGACWLLVDGTDQAVRLEAGDGFLLPSGRPFRLGSDLARPPDAAVDVFSGVQDGGIVTHNGGGDCFVVSSRFALAGEHADILLRMLPPIVHLKGEADRAALRWSVERMMQELRAPQPGGFLVIQHLAHMMLIQALRQQMTVRADTGANAHETSGVGWLFALADKQMGAAIGAIHADPAQRWTLETLAARANMSRSTFALRFKETVGSSPMDYVTRWRMRLAGDRLTHSGESVSAIALSLGYESESAFSTAFKRVMGCAPRRWGKPSLVPE